MGPIEAGFRERLKTAKEALYNTGYAPEEINVVESRPVYRPRRRYYTEQPCSPDCAWARAMRLDGVRNLTVERIIQVVCEHFELRKMDIVGLRRSKHIVRPRQIGMYLAKHLTNRSYPDIGRRFGDRDHTTVLHAVRRIGGLVCDDKEINKQVKDIRRALVGNAYWKIEGLDD